MAAALHLDRALLVDGRLHIVVPGGYRRQGNIDIHCCNGPRGLLDADHLRGNGVADLAEQLILQREQLILRTKDHIL